MTTTFSDTDLRTDAQAWLDGFSRFLTAELAPTAVFAPQSYWRDVLAFTGDLRTFSDEIPAELLRRQKLTKATNIRIAENRTPPRLVERAGIPCLEVIFEFDTLAGSAVGVARLVDVPERGLLVRSLFTTLDQLADHPERTGEHRPVGQADSSKFGGPNWLDRRVAAQAYESRDPDVLIVGGGQSGLTLAARLGQLDVDALVVDTHARPGDNWRTRYHALTLHNAVWLNDLPYMPFPATWPQFVPKDKLAGWFEAYVEAMEINFWGATAFIGGDYDEQSQSWVARVRRGDGTVRTLRPKHVVIATGVSGIPYVPELPGLSQFAGRTLHSSEYDDAGEFAGQRVVIVGTGNSAHDVAQDLHAHGIDVTMVQRSSTTIVSVDPSAAAADASYLTAPTLEDCDLLSMATVYPDLYTGSQMITATMKELDKDLIAALNRIGFRTDYGEEDTGQQMKFMRRGGGYYLNVGCSDLLISGQVGLVQYADTAGIVADGVSLTNGDVVEADAVILATGYQTQQEGVRALLGDEIADTVGPIWGYDDEGEVRNTWRRTAQPGLWFSAGNFQLCRIYSKVLAMQIRTELDNG